jgi:hypothetical protein
MPQGLLGSFLSFEAYDSAGSPTQFDRGEAGRVQPLASAVLVLAQFEAGASGAQDV